MFDELFCHSTVGKLSTLTDRVSEIDNYFDIDRMMSEHELLLAYRDHITDETVQQLLSITEMKLVQTGEDKKLRKRIFNILVECLQNIVNHAAGKIYDNEDNTSLLLIGMHGRDFFIITGNRILNSEVKHLEEKVNEINSWEHDSMREIYSTRLGGAQYSAKGGAGLGLVDIYKRSGRKLKHEIHPIDENLSFLSFHITIGADS